MAIVLDGTNGINTPNTFAFKNRVINGGFILNQRVYVSNTGLSSGDYAHDRFKAGASGCTYTFTQGSTGVNTTITITAGSLQQVIEGANMPEGGSYTLSWTGTAQGKIAGGSFAASPIIATGLTAGANCTIEFNTGTCTNVQVEAGSIQTSFDYRPFGTEFSLCERYFQKYSGGGNGGFVSIAIFGTTEAFTGLTFPQMRTGPSLSYSSLNDFQILSDGVSRSPLTTFQANGSSNNRMEIQVNWSSNLTSGFSAWLRITNPNGFYSLSAEL